MSLKRDKCRMTNLQRRSIRTKNLPLHCGWVSLDREALDHGPYTATWHFHTDARKKGTRHVQFAHSEGQRKKLLRLPEFYVAISTVGISPSDWMTDCWARQYKYFARNRGCKLVPRRKSGPRRQNKCVSGRLDLKLIYVMFCDHYTKLIAAPRGQLRTNLPTNLFIFFFLIRCGPNCLLDRPNMFVPPPSARPLYQWHTMTRS